VQASIPRIAVAPSLCNFNFSVSSTIPNSFFYFAHIFMELHSREYLQQKARELLEVGATTVDIFSADQLETESKRFLAAMCHDLPEYSHLQSGSRLTFDPSGKMGGSSSHHICVRELRAKAFSVQKTVIKIMRGICSREPENACSEPLSKIDPQIHCIPDAVMVRLSRDKIMAGNWHRDIYSKEAVFGGWLNLDDPCEQKPQLFLFGEASHLATDRKSKNNESCGFVKLSDAEVSSLKQRVLQIYPGQLLIFWEHIAHAVCNNATKRTTAYMTRLFTACGISFPGDKKTDDYSVLDRIKNKKPLPIKGGKAVPLVSMNGPFKNSIGNVQRANAWIKANLSYSLQQLTVKDLEEGVAAMALQLTGPNFPDYTPTELQLYAPHPLLSTSRKRWRSGCLVHV
jgi:hypothetical protein